jgi:hypothetical protein
VQGQLDRGINQPVTEKDPDMNLTTAQMTKLGIGLAVAVAVAKFAPHQAVKAAALGVAGVIVARQLPYVGAALA